MSDMLVVTERDLQGENPLFPSSSVFKDFILLNMWTQGIWLVDKKHSKFKEILTAAMDCAATAGDKQTLETLMNIYQSL